jgi:hypothetical protein
MTRVLWWLVGLAYAGAAVVMPTASDYVAMHWVHGPPIASVDDRYWGFAKREGESLWPAGLTVRSKRAASLSQGALNRWRVVIHNTITAPVPIEGTELLLEGNNGQQFPIHGVNHPAWAGRNFYIWPVASVRFRAESLHLCDACNPPS